MAVVVQRPHVVAGSGMPWTLCDTGPPALETGDRRGPAFACKPFVRWQ